MLHSCETKPYLKRCTMCFGYRGEIQQPSEMTQPLSAASPQTSAGRFVSGLSFVLLGILSCFQPQQCRSPFQNIRKFLASFTPSSNGLNLSTKHTCISICWSYASTKQGFVSLKATHMVSKVALLQPTQLEIIATSSH